MRAHLSKTNNIDMPNMSDTIENVLILQGGGSLGAFGCGVLSPCEQQYKIGYNCRYLDWRAKRFYDSRQQKRRRPS